MNKTFKPPASGNQIRSGGSPALPGVLIIIGIIMTVCGVGLCALSFPFELGEGAFFSGLGAMVYGVLHILAGQYLEYVSKALEDIRRQARPAIRPPSVL